MRTAHTHPFGTYSRAFYKPSKPAWPDPGGPLLAEEGVQVLRDGGSEHLHSVSFPDVGGTPRRGRRWSLLGVLQDIEEARPLDVCPQFSASGLCFNSLTLLCLRHRAVDRAVLTA